MQPRQMTHNDSPASDLDEEAIREDSASPEGTTIVRPTSAPLPVPPNIIPRSLTERESQLVKHLSRLQFFLATAPTRWTGPEDGVMVPAGTSRHPNLNRFPLPNGECVSCVFWNGLYHITGTDIVRALVFRFEAFSRPVQNMKKFEEGVFSDLRNLKPGTDACLEEPKSPFLDLLFHNTCIRTQKKVFYWFSVPHDRLFLDALERDLKREKAGGEPTTAVLGEPARSFRYDPTRGLYEQFAGKDGRLDGADLKPPADKKTVVERECGSPIAQSLPDPQSDTPIADIDENPPVISKPADNAPLVDTADNLSQPGTATTILFSRSLLKGSPGYKQRRKKRSRERREDGLRSDYGRYQESANEDSGSESESYYRPSSPYPALNPDSAEHDPSSLVMPLLLSAPTVFNPAADFSTAELQVAQGSHSVTDVLPAALPPVAWTQPLSRTPNFSDAHSSDLLLSVQPSDSNHEGRHGSPAGSISSLAAKGFHCPLVSCGRLFKRLEHLKRHVRTHTQERPYECGRCAKRFSRSDNLTQHVKTHDKADRGERLKTEASESADDEMARYLESEVEAMMTSEARSHQAVTGGVDGGPGSLTGGGSRMLGPFGSGLPHAGAGSYVGAAASLYGRINQQHGFPQIPFQQDWQSSSAHLSPAPVTAVQGNSNKRHRSMTPNPFANRGDTYPGTTHRFHPYVPGGLGLQAPPQLHRSSSVDSFPVPQNPTANTDHRLRQDAQHVNFSIQNPVFGMGMRDRPQNSFASPAMIFASSGGYAHDAGHVGPMGSTIAAAMTLDSVDLAEWSGSAR